MPEYRESEKQRVPDLLFVCVCVFPEGDKSEIDIQHYGLRNDSVSPEHITNQECFLFVHNREKREERDKLVREQYMKR